MSIDEVAPSSVRLTFARVRRVGEQWEKLVFIASKDLSKDAMIAMSMSEDVYLPSASLAAELSAYSVFHCGGAPGTVISAHARVLEPLSTLAVDASWVAA